MEKTSVFIYAHSLEIGGAENALLGLLEHIDTDKYDVDLFLLRHEGEWMTHIPASVNLLPSIAAYSAMGAPMKDVVLSKRQFRVALGRLAGRYIAKKRHKALGVDGDNNISNECSHKYTWRIMPEMSAKTYDVAISFLSPHYYVIHRVKAKKKIAWIHTDYSTFIVDAASELKMWQPYDAIISISQACKDSFLALYPGLTDKVHVIENIMPVKLMSEQADAFSVSDEMVDDGSIKLVTIGRFSPQKNMDNIPDICRRVNEKLKVRWYLIGYGGDEELIRQKISEAGMQKQVIILGKRENPYPYIRACDVYVQPSRYEGKSVSVREAQALGKPVIITAYPTSRSQLTDGEDGFIVPMDNEGCAAAVVQLLQHPEKLRRVAQNTHHHDYSNVSEIQKLYALMESNT